MTNNSLLISARRDKKDEFYTSYKDIEKEMECYFSYDPNVFRGKTVILPCDDYEQSNFTKYFDDNFDRFGLKRLISTCYVPEDGQTTIFDYDRKLRHGKICIRDCDGTHKGELKGNGDFRSDEVTELMSGSDIVVTNPPFSLFREFIGWCKAKSFVVMGNLNEVSCKEIFPLIRDDRMWFGPSIHSGDREFKVPDDYPLNTNGCRQDESGRYIRVKGIR